MTPEFHLYRNNFVLNLNQYPFDFLSAANYFQNAFIEAHNEKIEIINNRNLKSKINILTRYLLNKFYRFVYIKYFSLKKILGRTKYTIKNAT